MKLVLNSDPSHRYNQRLRTLGALPSLPLKKVTNLLLHWLGWGMQPGSTKLEVRRRLHRLCPHSSLVDPGCMSLPSQWSSKFVTFFRGREGKVAYVLTPCLLWTSYATIFLSLGKSWVVRTTRKNGRRCLAYRLKKNMMHGNTLLMVK